MMTSNEISGEELNNLGVLYKMTSADNIDSEFNNLIEKLNNENVLYTGKTKVERQENKKLTKSYRGIN